VKERIDPSRSLLALAAAQAGVVSRVQAAAHGFGDESLARVVRDGRWRRLGSGLYYCESGPEPWAALAWGGVLLGGEHAVLGAEAAAHLHGLQDHPPEVITVLVPHGTRRAPRGSWQFVQTRACVRRPPRGAPPRLDVEDVVLDLCDHPDRERVIALTTRAVQRRRTTPQRLAARLAERPRHSQRRLIHGVLADVVEGVQSPLEHRYLTDVERAHGLPRGRRQHRSQGSVRDVLYDEYATVVELDGRVGHDDEGWFKDMRRDNRSTRAGEATLRYGWVDVVERPCLVAAEVAVVLRRRGWTGVAELCPACARTVE
jgi:hypothetical protein